METGDDGTGGGHPRGAQPHTKEEAYTKDATGDPAVGDAPGKRYLQWSETSKYRWLERSLDSLLDLRASLSWWEGRLEEKAFRGREERESDEESDDEDLQVGITNRKMRIESLKQTILDGCRPEPWPMPGDSGTPTESLPGTPP